MTYDLGLRARNVLMEATVMARISFVSFVNAVISVE
jgi:hypothetical protein